jgi:hypothetical protein
MVEQALQLIRTRNHGSRALFLLFNFYFSVTLLYFLKSMRLAETPTYSLFFELPPLSYKTTCHSTQCVVGRRITLTRAAASGTGSVSSARE